MKVNVGTNSNSLEQISTAQVGVSANGTVGKSKEGKLSSLNATPSESATTKISSQFKAIQSALGAGSTFDTEKVSALKGAVDSGNYSVDAGNIANGLVAASSSFFN
jgi:negative regulator of flagellin synthesis FlgM